MKGILYIQKIKKGKFHAFIEYTKKTGKAGKLIITQNIFDNDKYNEKECEFETDKGTLIKLVVEGKTIYSIEKKKIVHNSENQSIKYQFDELFDIKNTLLPKDTRAILENFYIENYALKITKSAYFDRNAKPKPKFIFFKAARKGNSKIIIPNFSNINFDAFKNIYKPIKYDKWIKDAKISWRLIIGLGHESVYETSMTLHHIYGIPYIPASAIKGIVRNYIIQELFGDDEDCAYAEGVAIEDKNFCDVLGCPAEITIKPEKREKKTFESYYSQTEGKKKGDRKGKIIFFDAFPIETPNIVPDVMNVHYPDYYAEKAPPTDYQNPNPIFFLTVENTKFRFVIGTKAGKIDDFKIKGKSITQWLTEALSNHGIGAKTAVGYGRFKE